MTPQERQLLESLASRIAATAVPQKDAEADALIRGTIGTTPDALYILTQTALVQEIALNQANARLHELQQQIDTHRGESNQPVSFLGRLFGTGAPARQVPYQQQPPPAYAPPYDAPQYPPQYQTAPSQGSSFLRSAAMTATGVAAGALAFEGIESLFGHHGGYGGQGGFLGEPSETVVNNYYDQPSGEERRDSFLDSADTDRGRYDSSPDDTSPDTGNSDYDSGSSDSGNDFSSTDV